VLPPFNPRLPDTGSDMNGLLVVALLLTGFGTLVHAVVRRTA
jgi:LPXTG-motif cell wall-anchored protein